MILDSVWIPRCFVASSTATRAVLHQSSADDDSAVLSGSSRIAGESRAVNVLFHLFGINDNLRRATEHRYHLHSLFQPFVISAISTNFLPDRCFPPPPVVSRLDYETTRNSENPSKTRRRRSPIFRAPVSISRVASQERERSNANVTIRSPSNTTRTNRSA